MHSSLSEETINPTKCVPRVIFVIMLSKNIVQLTLQSLLAAVCSAYVTEGVQDIKGKTDTSDSFSTELVPPSDKEFTFFVSGMLKPELPYLYSFLLNVYL